MKPLLDNPEATTQTATARVGNPVFATRVPELLNEEIAVDKLVLRSAAMYVGRAYSLSLKNYAESAIMVSPPEEQQMTRQQLETAVGNYFRQHDGEQIELEELLNHFPCNLPDLVAVCDKLEEEGKIAEA